MKINGKWFGYCTNVHAGFDLDVTMENLSRFAVPVKNRCSPDEPMGIGLWLSDQTAIDLLSQDRVGEFRGWLDEQGLVPFTFNGFPYGNFHQEEVKKQVYLPTWADDSRREYSERLAQIQNELLPEGMEGSISTLPLAWDIDSADGDSTDADLIQQCADQLIELAEYLEELEERTGRLIYFCIEPEPGCIIQNSQTCIDFFERFLLGESSGRDELVRRYLRVCHDICHSAVMFEDQSEFIGNLYSAGLKIGKVQVSSAVHAKFEGGQSERDQKIIQQLSQFKEPRYLHQTVLRNERDETLFFEDLAPALEALQTVFLIVSSVSIN